MTFAPHQPGQEPPRWPWILARSVGTGRREEGAAMNLHLLPGSCALSPDSLLPFAKVGVPTPGLALPYQQPPVPTAQGARHHSCPRDGVPGSVIITA